MHLIVQTWRSLKVWHLISYFLNQDSENLSSTKWDGRGKKSKHIQNSCMINQKNIWNHEKKNNRSTVKHTNVKHTAVGWAPKNMARIIPKVDIILFPARLINTINWDLHTAKWSFQSRADSSCSQQT